MTKRVAISVMALLVIAGLSLSPLVIKADEGSWTGYVTDSMCAAKGANYKDADCAKRCVDRGSKYVLYIPADKKAFVLDPQDKVAEHAGHYVTVKGAVQGDTIKVSSITIAKEPSADK